MHREWLWMRSIKMEKESRAQPDPDSRQFAADSKLGSLYFQCRRTYSRDFPAASSRGGFGAPALLVVGVNMPSSLNTESAEKEQWDASQPEGMRFSTLSSPPVWFSMAASTSDSKYRFWFNGDPGYLPINVIG
jgi:hypothetical protein